MGGEGSIQGMITSLKNNRKALRSKKAGFRDQYSDQTLSKGKINDIKIDPETLESIKEQIRRTKRIERNFQMTAVIITLLVVSVVLLIIIGSF